MTPNGWRKNPTWLNAHYFRSGKALCGLEPGVVKTQPLARQRRVRCCIVCRNEKMGQLRLFDRNVGAVLDLIDKPSEAPMTP